MSSAFDWSSASKSEFEKTAEALIYSEYEKHPTLYARVIDGRGGDGGIDIDVRQRADDTLAEILQLKWFPQGFSGGFKTTRRRQIAHSFRVAMKEHPPAWTLVVPCEGTPAERHFVDELPVSCGDSVDITFMGRTALNVLLARHVSIHDWATRDAAVAALKLVGRESAALTRHGDLADELLRLEDRAGGRSAFWRENISITDGVITRSLVPKRPDAQEREPILYNVGLQFGPSHIDLESDFRRIVQYGGSGKVTFPPEVVRSFTISGPEWVQFVGKSGWLTLGSVEGASDPKPSRVTLLDKAGGVLATLKGETTHTGWADAGGTIEMKLLGGLVQEWQMANSPDGESTARWRFEPHGLAASDVSQSLKLIDQVNDASSIRLEVDGTKATVIPAGFATSGSIDEQLRQLVDDLAYLERSQNLRFHIPELLPTALERVWIRVARILLEGDGTVLPEVKGLLVTMTGESSTGLAELLEKGGTLGLRMPLTIQVLDEELKLEVQTYHPNMRAVGGREHVAALRRGDGADRVVEFVPRNRTPIVAFLSSVEWQKGMIQAWNIDGIGEHLRLQELLAEIEAVGKLSDDEA